MEYLASNIRFLRKKAGLTQAELAFRLGLNRSAIGAYEEGRAEPRLQVLSRLAELFGHDIHQLCALDLSSPEGPGPDAVPALRVLTVAVDEVQGREQITAVPVKAAAGYTTGMADPEFIASLPMFNMPLAEIQQERSYRIFQIKGDSMLPVPDRSYIIADFLDDWSEIRNGDCYVVVSVDDGIVYKRLQNHTNAGFISCVSDNPAYAPFDLPLRRVSEIWRARGVISFDLPGAPELPVDVTNEMLLEGIRDIKRKLNA